MFLPSKAKVAPSLTPVSIKSLILFFAFGEFIKKEEYKWNEVPLEK
jgi:hypothetical protein